jgi:hypothetical protein
VRGAGGGQLPARAGGRVSKRGETGWARWAGQGWLGVSALAADPLLLAGPCRFLQVRHCLAVHSSAGGAAGGGGGAAAAAEEGPAAAAGQVALDRTEVCLHFARKLLRHPAGGGGGGGGANGGADGNGASAAPWRRRAFMEAWAAAVPEEWAPPEAGLLAGEALEELPEGSLPGEAPPRAIIRRQRRPLARPRPVARRQAAPPPAPRLPQPDPPARTPTANATTTLSRAPPPAPPPGTEPFIVPFASRDLPLEPGPRFDALFQRRPRWERCAFGLRPGRRGAGLTARVRPGLTARAGRARRATCRPTALAPSPGRRPPNSPPHPQNPVKPALPPPSPFQGPSLSPTCPPSSPAPAARPSRRCCCATRARARPRRARRWCSARGDLAAR